MGNGIGTGQELEQWELTLKSDACTKIKNRHSSAEGRETRLTRRRRQHKLGVPIGRGWLSCGGNDEQLLFRVCIELQHILIKNDFKTKKKKKPAHGKFVAVASAVHRKPGECHCNAASEL